MKRLKLVPLTFILIIVIFTAIMAYVRLDNSHQLKQDFYRQWQKYYVVKINEKESYINTTPNSNKYTALS